MRENDENDELANDYVVIEHEGYAMFLQHYNGKLYYNIEGSTDSRWFIRSVSLYLKMKRWFAK